MQGCAGGCRGMQGVQGDAGADLSQQQPMQTMADHCRPSHYDIHGATCISDAFLLLQNGVVAFNATKLIVYITG